MEIIYYIIYYEWILNLKRFNFDLIHLKWSIFTAI